MSSEPIAHVTEYTSFASIEPYPPTTSNAGGRLTFGEINVSDVASSVDDSEARQSLFTRTLLVSFTLLCPVLMGFFYGQAGTWNCESFKQFAGLLGCQFPDSSALRPALTVWSFLLGLFYFIIALASSATTVFVVLCVYYWVSMVILVFSKLYQTCRPMPLGVYDSI